MIRLFTTWYEERLPERRSEYEKCLQQNLACQSLSGVFVLDESAQLTTIQPSAIVRSISARPTYADFFLWINEIVQPGDISIIANTDIAVDESLRLLRKYDWAERTVLALSRWDVLADGTVKLFEQGDSQDCWIFKGKVPEEIGRFPIGVYDCDNKIAWELRQAGYRVLNASLSLRTYHHHLSGYRSYEQKPAPDYGIRPPFLYVEPENLWGPLKAWQVQRKLKLCYFPWRMTWQKFWRYPGPVLVRRLWRRAARVLGASG
jgi:hypothetical protein